MPLLFAATLFVSASLLFMVQPMVGKLVLPLLGGSPAVWNACMVFFQALLLLGYLYADRLTRQESLRKQWVVHMAVLALPVAAFALAVAFGSRGTPIATAESLAPQDGSSAILSVLAILTVAIGIPFFVVSTSATLLQKWFTYTGHPSARDPYFLYAASNFGSLISLLGYPIFVEPYLTKGEQTWLWASGFVGLVALIACCGRAAMNPLGAPPVPAAAGGRPFGKPFDGPKPSGKPAPGLAPAPSAPPAPAEPAAVPVEPPPTWARMGKWTVLAFVPSSLMLGVTFHMTTDIASTPLLWVVPLALYLLTFIIAFSPEPSPASSWLAFLTVNLFSSFFGFAVDARRPGVFLIVLGNLAPVMILLLVFLMISGVNPGQGVSLFLYNFTFFVVALMCHYELARDRPSPRHLTKFFLIMSLGGVLGGIFNALVAPLLFSIDYELPLVLILACLMVPVLNPTDEAAAAAAAAPGGSAARRALRYVWNDRRVARVLDFVIPVLVGLAFWQLRRMPIYFDWYQKMLDGVASAVPFRMDSDTVYKILTFALPVMVCFFFVDRPLRFALAVAAILGPSKINAEVRGVVYTERSFFGILKIEEEAPREYRTYFYDQTDKDHPSVVLDPDGKPIVMTELTFRRLVHGTTLHGTQVVDQKRHPWDSLQLFTFANGWDNLAVAGAQVAYDPRQEPLTYYHRTGPVGAMFNELASRGKENEDVAMVGLGTGSVSCYARNGQRLTFYEIDPAVKKLVADTDEYFTYVRDARNRGARLDFRMGDARLKLKDDADRKYALLLVDAFSSDSIPVHLLTVEAVQLYLDRLQDDGILALHISNKWLQLEPVVAAIAARLNLVARVWRDGGENREGRFGKTASSWVVLARKREDLGDRLCSPIGDLVDEYGRNRQLLGVIQDAYPEVKAVLNPLPPKDFKGPKQPERDQKAVLLGWLDKRGATDPKARQFADWVRLRDSEYTSLMALLKAETGYGFVPVEVLKGVDAWTDDYADVMRVMIIPEVLTIRRFFGLPTPVEQ